MSGCPTPTREAPRGDLAGAPLDSIIPQPLSLHRLKAQGNRIWIVCPLICPNLREFSKKISVIAWRLADSRMRWPHFGHPEFLMQSP